jgi:1-acyl-sn-glycerol-3-phosphate acyltransferase
LIVLARIRDWAFTVPFAASFGLVLLVFDGLQRLARPLGRRPHETVVNGLQASIVAALRLCGTRVVVERAGGLTAGRPCLFVSNHQSMFDIPILGTVLAPHYLKYVSKRELVQHWIPSISYNLRRGGNALIDRSHRAEAVGVIRRLGQEEVAGRGVSAVIFPEGTRARGGVLAPFKPQGTLALMAGAPRAPVVPVAIDNSWRLLRHGMKPVPFGTRVRVFIGEPIERAPGEDAAAVVRRVEGRIREVLDRWRGEADAARTHAAPTSSTA